jgi:hypothetical protein
MDLPDIYRIFHPTVAQYTFFSAAHVSLSKITQEVIGTGKDYLKRTPAAHQLRERMCKWDFIKLKNYRRKEMVSKLKRVPTQWGKILASYTSDKVQGI